MREPNVIKTVGFKRMNSRATVENWTTSEFLSDIYYNHKPYSLRGATDLLLKMTSDMKVSSKIWVCIETLYKVFLLSVDGDGIRL